MIDWSKRLCPKIGKRTRHRVDHRGFTTTLSVRYRIFVQSRSKLRAYQNDKRKSFEELCFQVAKKLYGDFGEFTSIDDSGGGDGVEFFLSLPDGTQWGWQAKFYFTQP